MTANGTRAVSRPAVVAALALALLGGSAAAQQRPQARQPAAPAPPPATEATGAVSGWIKQCQGEGEARGCVVQQEVYGLDGNQIATAAVQETQAGQRRRMVMAVPLGLWIEDGVQVRVDQRAPLSAPFGTCLPNGCFAALDVSNDLLQVLRQGQRLVLAVRTPDRGQVNILMPLDGFGAAFDGPAADAQALQAHRQRFEEDLKRRVEEAQRAAQAQQGQQPAGAQGTAPQRR